MSFPLPTGAVVSPVPFRPSIFDGKNDLDLDNDERLIQT